MLLQRLCVAERGAVDREHEVACEEPALCGRAPLDDLDDSQGDALAVCTKTVDHVSRDFEAEWAVVVRDGHLVATNGPTPTTDWVIAFVAGSVEAGAAEVGPDDVAWAPLDDNGGALVIGRDGRPFRSRERRQLNALARIIGWRLSV